MPSRADAAFVARLVRELHAAPRGSLQAGVRRLLPSWRRSWKYLPLVIYSDFEPDDLLSISQEWQLFAERYSKDPKEWRPLVIFCASFVDKDAGTVFEKKLILARLMLGLQPDEYPILVAETDDGKDGWTLATHPHHGDFAAKRSANIQRAAEDFGDVALQFGDGVDVAIIAPGRGVLGDVLRTVKACRPRGYDALRTRARFRMYTGSFNSRYTLPQDWDALRDVLAASPHPLVDLSKFVFFGGPEAHPCTDSIGTFEPLSLSVWINRHAPRLAAAWLTFSAEFDGTLVHPEHEKLMVRVGSDGRMAFLSADRALEGEQLQRFRRLAALHGASGCQAYCAALLADDELFRHVAPYKQATVRSLSQCSADGPLCDQLCFLWDYFAGETPEMFDEGPVGEWVVDEGGFSSIHGGAGATEHGRGLKAKQPKLRNPKDEAVLLRLSELLSEYTLRHLEMVSKL